jgi:nucleotide-binding universal stress UspA family protein
MSYKTILVHVDQSPRAKARIELAARLAGEHGAHLIGAAMTGVSRFIFYGSNVDITRTVLDAQLKILVDNANAALTQFDAIAAGVPGLSFERRVVDDDEAPGLAMQARYADLVVLSQSDPNPPIARIAPDLASYVMLNSACAVLIAPFGGAPATLGTHPLVAWDDSVQASRAVANAVPLLQRARKVSLAVFNAVAEPLLAGADIALYLARHGVNVEVLREETEFDVGFALLELAATQGADLLVMGGYGHARLREVLLGGVTQTVLANMTIPVLMSH